MDAKSNGAHTPGPWWADDSRYGTIYIEANAVIDKRLLQEICAVGPTESGREQQEANARLIAAAPDLLSAAEHAEAWIGDMPHGDNCYLSDHYDGDPGNQCNCGKEVVLSLLNDAIAKATGGAA